MQEARRLIVSGRDVAAAGYAVGYESVSRFSREYARLFGSSPSRDTKSAKATDQFNEVFAERGNPAQFRTLGLPCDTASFGPDTAPDLLASRYASGKAVGEHHVEQARETPVEIGASQRVDHLAPSLRRLDQPCGAK